MSSRASTEQLRYIYVNPAIEAATGLTVQQVIGRASADLAAPTTVGSYWRAVRDVFEVGRELTVEFGYPTPEGQRWFQARLFPEFTTDGEVDTVLSIARDVSDFLHAQEQLREAESRYRTLVEQIPAITYIDQLGRSTAANWVSPQIEAILGYTPQEWLALPYLEQAHAEDRARIERARSEARNHAARVLA